MRYDPSRHHRRSIHLPGYDYAQPGASFVTICTQGRRPAFAGPALRAIAEEQWRALERAGAGSLGAIVRSSKAAVAHRPRRLLPTTGAPPWQRGCYEHIIRDDAALAAVRASIAENPARRDARVDEL